MFTGIIDSIGIISRLVRTSGAVSIAVKPMVTPYKVMPGDSVAINGVCLTVESFGNNELFFTAVPTTISKSSLAGLGVNSRVNLERALTPESRIGGHFVLGHVDGIGKIISDRISVNSRLRRIAIPSSLLVLAAPGGSVAIDGVSLTIADSDKESITVSLIPFTLNNSTLGAAKSGDTVNIECDVLARYIHHIYTKGRNAEESEPGIADKNLLNRLETLGF